MASSDAAAAELIKKPDVSGSIGVAAECTGDRKLDFRQPQTIKIHINRDVDKFDFWAALDECLVVGSR